MISTIGQAELGTANAICLPLTMPPEELLKGAKVIVAGWGYTENEGQGMCSMMFLFVC